MIVSRIKPKTRESIVIELTAANDLSRFIKELLPWLKDRAINLSIYAILRAAKAQSQSRRVYRSRTGNKYPGQTQRPLSGTHQLPLTTHQVIGMIRGLFCLLFPKKSFEELDGGQHTFRQKTCKTG